MSTFEDYLFRHIDRPFDSLAVSVQYVDLYEKSN